MSSHQYLRKEDVEGKVVIDSTGKAIGKAKEIAFSLDGTLALIVVRPDNLESQIPTSKIMGFADYVVLKPESGTASIETTTLPRAPTVTPRVPLPPPPFITQPPIPGTATAACPQCRSPLRAGAKFCTRCGARTM